MEYIKRYDSPLGMILIASDEIGLTGLWFEGQKYFARTLSDNREEKETRIIKEAEKWLDSYFLGEKPGNAIPLNPAGTVFQKSVWNILSEIPYGSTITYGDIASRIARETGRSHMSAEAVGGAVGHNPISIIIPCHRVVGKNGSLTGYAGGLERKIRLLEIEKADISALYIPRKSTAK